MRRRQVPARHHRHAGGGVQVKVPNFLDLVASLHGPSQDGIGAHLLLLPGVPRVESSRVLERGLEDPRNGPQPGDQGVDVGNERIRIGIRLQRFMPEPVGIFEALPGSLG